MSTPSLTKNIQGMKVNTGSAHTYQTYRIQNTNGATYHAWNGTDNLGRQVCADSYVTKTAGVHSALDRLNVENAHRPQYSNHVYHNMEGVSGVSANYGNRALYAKADRVNSTMQQSGRTSVGTSSHIGAHM